MGEWSERRGKSRAFFSERVDKAEKQNLLGLSPVHATLAWRVQGGKHNFDSLGKKATASCCPNTVKRRAASRVKCAQIYLVYISIEALAPPPSP